MNCTTFKTKLFPIKMAGPRYIAELIHAMVLCHGLFEISKRSEKCPK